MSIWVVVPAYNEAYRLAATLGPLVASGHEVVLVDDGSTDTSAAVAAAFPVWILRHPINCGQGAALRTGIAFALERGADVVVTFDADGQHDASDIPHLVEPVVTGRADVVLGSRFRGRTIGLRRRRRLLLYAARAFTRIVSGVPVTDPHNGLRAMSRAAAGQIRIVQDGMAHASELIDEIRRRRLCWCEVPVTVRYTEATLAKGQSAWNALRILGHLLAGRVMR